MDYPVELQDQALDEMVKRALHLSAENGLAFVLVLEGDMKYPRIAFAVVGNGYRDPDSSKEDDTGVNFYCVAFAKLGQMLVELRDSGMSEQPLRYGEVEFLGGLVRRIGNSFLFTGFSGLPQEEDVLVAEYGMVALLVP